MEDNPPLRARWQVRYHGVVSERGGRLGPSQGKYSQEWSNSKLWLSKTKSVTYKSNWNYRRNVHVVMIWYTILMLCPIRSIARWGKFNNYLKASWYFTGQKIIMLKHHVWNFSVKLCIIIEILLFLNNLVPQNWLFGSNQKQQWITMTANDAIMNVIIWIQIFPS